MSEEAPLTTTIKLPGANQPWFVIRSDNAAQLDQQLNELMSLGIAATVGRAQNMLEAQFNMGLGLEARAVQAPVQQQAPAAPPVQQAPQQAYPPADVSGVPFQQQQYAPPVQQQYAPPQQQQYQQPAPQAAPATPGAPMICGQPAKLVTGNKNGRAWQAWADPRPKNVTDGMERTDDPNHMGLMQGTHSFWKFIK